MKRISIIFILWIVMLRVQAQDFAIQTGTKFKEFYAKNQIDSIYGLFSPELKAALDVSKTAGVISQLKSGLGEIITIRKQAGAAPGFSELRLSFEKPFLEIGLTLKDNLIAGIHQRPVEKNDAKQDNNSIDNFSISLSGTIYGTLKIPENTGKVPVVLFIAGSGPTDRNMNQAVGLQTNSFLMLADSLAKHGIASLRYDKRGVGKSMSAAKPGLTLDDYIQDAVAITEKLKGDDRFSSVIIMGHSEGSLIGLVASIKSNPSAYISLEGPADNMSTIIRAQLKKNLSAADFKAASALIDQLDKGKTSSQTLPASINDLFTLPNQEFLVSANKYSGALEMKKLKIPALIIAGSSDLQVDLKQAELLKKNGGKAKLQVIAEMNHVLKKTSLERTSNVASYNQPAMPIHPELVPTIISFIQQNK